MLKDEVLGDYTLVRFDECKETRARGIKEPHEILMSCDREVYSGFSSADTPGYQAVESYHIFIIIQRRENVRANVARRITAI